jgi:diguanylate cyclase (GGDEF)-like protein
VGHLSDCRDAEEVRHKIKAFRIVHDGRELGAITASLGLACSPEHCQTGRLVQAADAALLRPKRAGRNRVIVAEVSWVDQSAAN